MSFAFVLPVITLLGVVPPLAPEQREAIARWEIDPETIDEPGLYVLLNNATAWPAAVREQARGERLVDLSLVRDEPAAWRGEVFVIEGALRGVMSPGELTSEGVLAREGWEGVEAWTVELDDGGKAIVLLVAPPDTPEGRRVGAQRVMTEPFPTLRTVGRFFKTMELELGGGGTAGFPVFVGKSARLTGRADPGRADREGGLSPWAAGALLLLIGGLVIAFIVVRRITSRGPGPLTRRLEEARARHQAEAEREAQAYRADLPEDPVEALGALAAERTVEEEEAAVEREGGVSEADEDEQRGADDARRSD